VTRADAFHVLAGAVLVCAFVVPVAVVAFEPGEWLAAVILGVALLIAGAVVSVHADSLDA
jgi:peptidoglycan/LPS O-acetylase OafA/YrhL